MDRNRPLPPLKSLKVFEAAARHLSFSKAAEELHVTPAAVSRQIRALEDHLGLKLFHRMNRALSLTEAAHRSLPKLREGFASLGEAVEAMHDSPHHDVLTVAMAPSFAAKWFMPRLHRFTAAHPDVDLRIAAGAELVDKRQDADRMVDYFVRNNVDLAVRFGGGVYPGCRVDKLFDVTLVPMCSPALLADGPPLSTPADLGHHTLLHDDTDYTGRLGWSDWLKAAGVTQVDARHGLRFNHVALALEAAIDGQGVVLSMEHLAAADIAAGRLVVPFALALPLDRAYYAVSPAPAAERDEVAAFRDWLMAQARADDGR